MCLFSKRLALISLTLLHHAASLSFFIAHAQLAADIQQIKADYDLMGGVVTVFCDDQIVYSIPFGLADLERQLPVTDSTLFRVASISKTITAMAFLRLVDQGLVSLDDDIGNILGYSVRNPYYPSTPITPRMLLSHTSSMKDGNTYSSFLNATTAQLPIPNLSQLLTPGGLYYSITNFLNKPPGTYFTYSNINFVIIATLIEKITGRRFDEYCRDSLLRPLGIRGSFNLTHLDDINYVAVLYRKIGGSWIPQADNYQGIPPTYDNLAGYVPGTNGARFSPQGGFRGSGTDLSILFRTLLNKGSWSGFMALTPAMTDTMLSNQWTYDGNNGENYYGLFNSWGLGIHRILSIPNADVVLAGSNIMFGHPGEAYGLVSDAYIDTTRRLGLVFMTNGCGTGYQTSAQTAFYTVEKAVFDAINPYADALNCLTGAPHAMAPTNDIGIFPNPFSSLVHITPAPTHAPCRLTLKNAQGKVVYEHMVSTEKAWFDFSFLPNGFYVLQLQGNRAVVSRLLVKATP
ncbi:MAG: serine hydrolase [Chitinophagales bacterium]|nr:serine hydrolase [Chitinophagales bacterium]MDW8428882.1 serine hydrolase [Chitinophagales bacterium]